MKQLYPDLWQAAQELRFGTLRTHAYVLEHAAGRDMIYVAEERQTLEAVTAQGAPDQIYLSHNHEITEGLTNTGKTLGVPLVGHQNMQKFFAEGQGLDRAIDTEGTELQSGGIEAIHTPGHTDNNLCYRYVSPHGKTYLFVGDTLYPDHGTWKALVMQSHGGNRETLMETLQTLKGIQADVIVPSVALGAHEITEMTQQDWRNALDDAARSIT